jgi:hypothetical protein
MAGADFFPHTPTFGDLISAASPTRAGRSKQGDGVGESSSTESNQELPPPLVLAP